MAADDHAGIENRGHFHRNPVVVLGGVPRLVERIMYALEMLPAEILAVEDDGAFLGFAQIAPPLKKLHVLAAHMALSLVLGPKYQPT